MTAMRAGSTSAAARSQFRPASASWHFAPAELNLPVAALIVEAPQLAAVSGHQHHSRLLGQGLPEVSG